MLLISRGPPELSEETNRSVERPPSRLRAWDICQPAGDWVESAWLSSARLQGDVVPIHQRFPPSWTRIERMAILLGSRPFMGFWFSTNKGPAWRSSLEFDTALDWDLLLMEAVPDESIR